MPSELWLSIAVFKFEKYVDAEDVVAKHEFTKALVPRATLPLSPLPDPYVGIIDLTFDSPESPKVYLQ
ncbi:MAG TPA: hypothetical protein DCM40_09830, partial [Maribacter sp.]|nr:hypothetical protein [Maribacter sp.]